jgi:two-component system cell cycle sensor histidine kinase/response regulator CckA
MTVLIIDDEEMIRDLAQKILLRAGFDVLTAPTGQSGVQLYAERHSQIDLVLLDLTMGDMPGLETLKKLREVSPDLPCLISSGHAPRGFELPEELKHNVHFLQKPYRANQLTAAVNQMLSGVPRQSGQFQQT